jgi:putative aldouronate transport system substrate-binding protein
MCLILALGLLAGCTTGPTPTPGPIATTLTTLTFATHSGTNASMAPPSNDLPLYQYLEKLTNVRIEWQVTAYDNYKEVMNTRIAGGDKLPDILNLYALGNYETLAKDNIIIDQTALIDKYAVWTKDFFKKNPAYKALMTAPDGKIYCIENTVLDSHLGLNIMINKYALERSGVAMPTTSDEFYKMLVAFKAKDINGNGKSDEIPLATDKASLVALGNAFGLEIAWDWNKYFVAKSGKLVSNYSLPEYKAYVTFLNKLYSEGLMNKDYATVTYDKMIEYVTNGLSGAVGYWATYAYLFGEASPDAAPFKADNKQTQVPIFVPMDPLKDSSNKQYFIKRSGLNGDGMGITVDCAKELQPVAMKWIDFLFASPTSLEAQYNGVPDITFKKNADGTITKILPADGSDWSASVTKIGGNQPPRAHQQLMDGWRNSWLPNWLDLVDQGQQKFYRDGTVLPIQFTEAEQTAITTVQTDLDTFIDENITAFITGTKPMSDYDAFAASLGTHGLDAVKASYEARYARQIKNK